ncbi:hypothetical protein EVAR_96328_1 [Eumeta japonica]|uniref:Reverse transcriptase domain-containing protein n=1 Tax=Eumeta variegata TaxID=151549 RepID=A0A4C1VV25_EUMVA|nr:hypothetical protein EVAR_96328_1 [Eumeta japonica]
MFQTSRLQTMFRLVVHGRRPGERRAAYESVNHLTDLHDQVKAHFELDALGIEVRPPRNIEEERALKILNESSRLTGGGWQTSLLWRADAPPLSDKYDSARSRLKGIERKIDSDAMLKEAYSAQIRRLIDKGYAVQIERDSVPEQRWFLSHFAVVNPNKPGKIQLVFDAAARHNGVSLNDRLLSGPNLLNPLLGILLKFRIGKVAVTGDIEDMFLRIKIQERDRRAQLFLWRDDQTKEPQIFVMESIIFSATSSPACAIFVLNKNAERYTDEYPEAVAAIKHGHYMDDCIYSVDSPEIARRLIEDVKRIHGEGNFRIRGRATNSAELREHLPAADSTNAHKVSLAKTEPHFEKTLA